jgi:hypothetical protein
VLCHLEPTGDIGGTEAVFLSLGFCVNFAWHPMCSPCFGDMKQFTPRFAWVLSSLLVAALQTSGCTSGTAPPQNCLNPQPIPPYCPFQPASSTGGNADNGRMGSVPGGGSGAAPTANGASSGGGSAGSGGMQGAGGGGSSGASSGATDASADTTMGPLDASASPDAGNASGDAAPETDGTTQADGPGEEADSPSEVDTGDTSSPDVSNTIGSE